jgi:hypothetical protein
MKVVVNPDGSTTVSCDGSTVTINPPAPTLEVSAGGASDPGAVSALVAVRRRQGERRPGEEADADGVAHALVLHGQGEIDVDRIRRLLDDAGLEHLAIEITPPPRHA